MCRPAAHFVACAPLGVVRTEAMTEVTKRKEESLESKDESVSSARLYLNIKGRGDNLSSPHPSPLSIPLIHPSRLAQKSNTTKETRGWYFTKPIYNKPTPTQCESQRNFPDTYFNQRQSFLLSTSCLRSMASSKLGHMHQGLQFRHTSNISNRLNMHESVFTCVCLIIGCLLRQLFHFIFTLSRLTT